MLLSLLIDCGFNKKIFTKLLNPILNYEMFIGARSFTATTGFEGYDAGIIKSSMIDVTKED